MLISILVEVYFCSSGISKKKKGEHHQIVVTPRAAFPGNNLNFKHSKEKEMKFFIFHMST